MTLAERLQARRRPPMDPKEALRLRQQAVGVRLRLAFDPIVHQPIPQEWLDLLRQADARTS